MAIIHNMSAMNAQRQYKISTGKKAKSSEKLSSGYRINRSADDAAGLQISEKMRWQIRGLNKGQNNIMEGVSWLQVGDGAMGEVSELLHRMTELCVQAANDTNTESDREAIQAEITEIKKEINRIGDTTDYNTQPVFQNEDVMMDIDGAAGSLSIFNSSYDAATGNVEYGGFIFNGERVTWDKVDANMVDPATGLFNEGTYTYTDSNNNVFEIRCEAGAAVPELSRIISVTASNNGLSVDGKVYSWSDLKDENGNAAGSGNVHGGVWTLEYNNSTIAFYIPEDVTDMNGLIDAVNSCSNSQYTYKLMESYSGSKEEQAVDAEVIKNLVVTNSLANNISGNSVAFTIRADANGIWLEENGNPVTGSEKTWADMGITSWDSGNSIQANYTYTYLDNDGTNDTSIGFDFTLSDVTSVDSVIDGLDGVLISGNRFVTNYEAEAETTIDDNVLKLQMTYNKGLTFEEEKALGRDFDQQTDDAVGSSTAGYDAATGNITLDYADANNNPVVSYTGTDSTEKKQMADDIDKYIDYVLELKKNAALAGKNPQQISIGTVNLTDIVGSSNVTTSGHFDQVITITGSMENTDGSSGYRPGVSGMQYPSAYIDFSGLGSGYTLDDLRSAGFDSTCKTCSNHYSIIFSDVSSGKYELTRDGEHYTLKIDIDSLKMKGGGHRRRAGQRTRFDYLGCL